MASALAAVSLPEKPKSACTAESHPVNRTFPPVTSTQDVDRAVRAGIARLTGGLAPSALAGAFLDWAIHLAASPGKQFELASQAIAVALENATFASRCVQGGAEDPCRCALPQDNRFRAAEWQAFPFDRLRSFLPLHRTMVGGGDDRCPRRQQAA